MLISNLNYLESVVKESELQGGNINYSCYPSYPCCYPPYDAPKLASASGSLFAYATGHNTTSYGTVKMVANSEEGFSLTMIYGGATAES
jgi:hypothetical protein